MPTYSNDPRERAAEEKCVADVAAYGLHVMHVGGDNDWPEFAYTVGLWRTFEQAELIILGLPQDAAHAILNYVADLARDGRRFHAGDVAEDVLDDHPIQFRAVPPAQGRAHFGWARWYHAPDAFPTLQLVYPDMQGRWPWDPDASDGFRAQQPVLELTPLPEWARRAR